MMDLIKRAFEMDLSQCDRQTKRQINKDLDNSKWMIVYPFSDDDDAEYNDLLYFVLTKRPITYIPLGNRSLLDTFSIDSDNDCWVKAPCLSIHLTKPLWIDTKTIKRGYIEPYSTEDLESELVVETISNLYVLGAISSFMHLSESDFEIENEIEKYLVSLPPDILRIDVIYSDVDSHGRYEYGDKTCLIVYKSEIVGYIKVQGRELMGRDYYTKDMKKYINFLKEIVDNGGFSDKIYYSNIKEISGDADVYLKVPKHSKKQYGE